MAEIITGMAGTGKSHLLKERVSANPKGTLVVAPTGIAALLVGGITIHRAFKLSTLPMGEGDIKVISMNDKIKFIGIERVVFDEWFMTRADVYNAANWTMQMHRSNKFEPFGGAEVFCYGDPFQLPPILSDRDKKTFDQMGYKSVWPFSLPFMKDAGVTILTKNYRQGNEEFSKALSEIRLGRPSKWALELINSRVGATLDTPFITLTPKNIDVESENLRRYEQIVGKEQWYHGLLTNDYKESDCLAPIHLCLKVGTQVMMIKNDLSDRWVNGTMAVVSRLGDKSVWVTIKGVEHEVEQVAWERIDSSYDPKSRKTNGVVTGTYSQLPLKLAYAITIHKSQGQTLSKGAIQLNGRITTAGQAYTMLSRFTELESFSLSRPLTTDDISADKEVLEWYESIAG